MLPFRSMPSFLVRNLPPEIHEWLRERSARNDRSMAAELRVILARVKEGDIRDRAKGQ